jgi:uncharacterized protein YidB (DUF937 family)
MALLDQVLGQILGQQQSGQTSGLQEVLAGLLGGGSSQTEVRGGIAGLVDRFKAAGLGHIVDSWIGTGSNQPVSPQQLQQVLGDEQAKAMADRSGLEHGDFLAQLSRHLPRAVDAMTPNGQLPDQQTMSV